MIILTSTSDKLQVVLAGAVTTNQLQCYASFRDVGAASYTPDCLDSVTNDTTDVSVVTSPGTGLKRVVDYVSVWNTDTVAATVTIKYEDGVGTETTLWKGTLAAGAGVEYVEGAGFRTK
jgi:hypothetical protein